MPAGRPTKYNKAMQDKADAYVNGGFSACGDPVPTVAGLACELGVTRRTIHNWAAEHGQFLHTLEACNQTQERVALAGGLRNELNATIVKLLLANHGYSDKTVNEHTGAHGAPLGLQVSFVDSKSS